MPSAEKSAPASAEQLSKRALKRLAKQVPDKPVEERTDREASVASSEADLVVEADSFVEHVNKRIRNLQKRKAKLDKYREIAEQAAAEGKEPPLNADQRLALTLTETVEAPLKELNELLAAYKSQEVRAAASRAALVAEARAEGVAEARKQLLLTTQFLRAASIKRQLLTVTPADESAAVEQLLQTIYSGEEAALAALDKLHAASDEPIVGSVTFAAVKTIAQTPVEQLFAQLSTGDAAEARPSKISFMHEEPEEEVEQTEVSAQGAEVEHNGHNGHTEHVEVEEKPAQSTAEHTNGGANGANAKPRDEKKNRKPRNRRERKPTPAA